MNTEIIACAVAFILLLATFIVVTKIKNSKIKKLKNELEGCRQSLINRSNECKITLGKLNSLKEDYNTVIDKNSELTIIINNIDIDLLNNLEAISDKGNKLNYFKVQTIQEKDLGKFNDCKIGDKVAYVTRRVKKKVINVPVKVQINRG